MTQAALMVLAPFVVGLLQTNPPPPPPPPCSGDDFYYASDKPRDVVKALACYRECDDWIMVAILQLNGEGTPVDIAGARASFNRDTSEDGDHHALDRIIKEREANPTAKFPRVDFCRDVAYRTDSLYGCRLREEQKKTAKSDSQVAKLRVGLDARARAAFDSAQAAYTKVAHADRGRAYQEYIEGAARDQFAMDQEARVRRNFMATLKKVIAGPAADLINRRSFADADKELNVVYSGNLSSYVKYNEESAVDAEGRRNTELAAEYRQRSSDYKTKSRAAQHEWVRYRDAMGDLAAARWPSHPGVRDVARTLVTEDRICELREK